MTYAAQGNLGATALGLYLKIYSAKGVYNQLSDAAELWKFIMKKKAADAKGREHRFELASGYGMGAAQFLPVGSGRFPTARPSTLQEGIALFKEYAVTVSVAMDLMDKGSDDLAVYGLPMAQELMQKGKAAARMLSISGYGDGTGAIGHAAATPVASTSADSLVVEISNTSALAGRSNLAWLCIGDAVKFAAAAGTAHSTINNNGTTVGYWLVTDHDELAGTCTLQPYTDANVLINITTATLGNTDPTSGDYIYRLQTTPNDLGAISTNDWNGISEVWAGLESLTAIDGRLVNNITMSGATGGSRFDNQAAVIDYDALQSVMSKVNKNVGKGRYKYDTALMSYGAMDAMMISGETDRRFGANTDLDRGVKGQMSFRYGKDAIVLDSDEFCPDQRIVIPPQSKDVLQFIGRDFQPVNVGGASEFMPVDPTTGIQLRAKNAYMQGSGTLVCLHPAAIGVITNFTLPGN